MTGTLEEAFRARKALYTPFDEFARLWRELDRMNGERETPGDDALAALANSPVSAATEARMKAESAQNIQACATAGSFMVGSTSPALQVAVEALTRIANTPHGGMAAAVANAMALTAREALSTISTMGEK